MANGEFPVALKGVRAMVESSSFPDPAVFPPEQRVRSVHETSRKMDRRRQRAKDGRAQGNVAEKEGKGGQDTEDELESSSQWGETETQEESDRRLRQQEDSKSRLDIFA